MLLNDVIKQVHLSKRAVKYYEEQGLLHVEKSPNGYRDYSDENIQTLKEISIYRKLGIGISDIKKLLKTKDTTLLEQIYLEKKASLSSEQKELDALSQFIANHNVDTIYSIIDYKTVAQALQDMVPGFFGYFFINHFMPYLQISITTKEQQKAYENILSFWDNTTIRIPFFMRIVSFFSYRLLPKASLTKMVESMDSQIQHYLNLNEEDYEKLKKQTYKNVKLRNSFLFKFHPAFISQRKFMRNLQDQGYNDIFIPNMIALSPKYKEYHKALDHVNQRICEDLGLYYDSNYNLVMKK